MNFTSFLVELWAREQRVSVLRSRKLARFVHAHTLRIVILRTHETRSSWFVTRWRGPWVGQISHHGASLYSLHIWVWCRPSLCTSRRVYLSKEMSILTFVFDKILKYSYIFLKFSYKFTDILTFLTVRTCQNIWRSAKGGPILSTFFNFLQDFRKTSFYRIFQKYKFLAWKGRNVIYISEVRQSEKQKIS